MEQKCKSYHTKKEKYYLYDTITGEHIPKEKEVGICFGTKECEKCHCEGNKRNCDFYSTVRHE